VKKHVLIIDDDPAISDYITVALQLQGYFVTAVATRDAALANVKTNGFPDIILLDFMMPGMTADAFIKALLEINPRLPRIVLMTAGVEAYARARGVGIAEVLQKPFDATVLFDLIEPCAV
jgi:CheY-like chemotaxis protein